MQFGTVINEFVTRFYTNTTLTFSLSDESFAVQAGGQCAAVLESGM